MLLTLLGDSVHLDKYISTNPKKQICRHLVKETLTPRHAQGKGLPRLLGSALQLEFKATSGTVFWCLPCTYKIHMLINFVFLVHLSFVTGAVRPKNLG
jgi:hypothetical protein